ncbi:LOW QUALITY PROTEIN: hypothetical protein Bca101_036268 [Brassica carinata]
MEHISRLTDPLEGRIHPIDRRLKDSYSFFTIADQVLGINCSEKPLLAKKQEFRRHLPQINYPPCSVPPPPEFSMRRLGTLRRKSGLSGLVFLCEDLPPILHIRSRLSLRSYSEGARGLTPLVLRIFTENSISLGPRRRQRGSRYTIRAGRYLCDKEFCYLRTVRVTAAVYRGFHSKLITLLLLTFQHRAGVRLYTSCYHLAESCVFNKQSLPPGMCRFPNQKIESTPSPVTGSFCLVPSAEFSQAPWYALPDHLCRFRVRSVHREDRPPNSKFFPGSFNLLDYDKSRDYKQTRDYGRSVRSALSRPLL